MRKSYKKARFRRKAVRMIKRSARSIDKMAEAIRKTQLAIHNAVPIFISFAGAVRDEGTEQNNI